MKRGVSSLLADSSASVARDMFLKEAQEQPDNVQFAQDFSNLAFQFMQDRAPALMKYLLGFEVVDRAENGTRAVGIFGFKIDGQYYYVPAFFMNSQVKGVDSIMSKSTNSFVPLTEEWVNYIINRKANELGKEAPGSGGGSAMKDMENPNFDFLQHPTVGPLGGHSVGKVASAEDPSPWSLSMAWREIMARTDGALGKDAGFTESVVGAVCKLGGVARPFGKSAESPVVRYLSDIGGPAAERTILKSLTNVKMANAALEFYDGPASFHVGRYSRNGCYALRKAAQEAEASKPKVEITDDASNESEARDVIENGFTVRDRRDDAHRSKVVELDYEKLFQNPDRPGVYDVLVEGGDTEKAYVIPADRLFRKGVSGSVTVYFPGNNQAIHAKNRDVLCDGGNRDGFRSVYDAAKSVGDCSVGSTYIFVGRNGTVLPEFTISSVSREDGERPVLSGSFRYDCENTWDPDPTDDFTNHWAHDQFHDRSGLAKSFGTFSICKVELADFDGQPKLSHGVLVLPRGWRALEVSDKLVQQYSDFDLQGDSDGVENDRRASRRHELGSLAQLTLGLRKEGVAKLEVRHDNGDYSYSFDDTGFVGPLTYKKAAVALVSKLSLGWDDTKSILGDAESSGQTSRHVKVAQVMPSQFIGVTPSMPPGQAPSSDPYTGIPVYESPYVDSSEMPLNGVDTSVSRDNELGENIGGDISRQSGSGEAEFDQEAMDLAAQAAQAGQKDVFDKAAIGGLAKVYDTGAVIDSYIPEFMDAVDRLGRTLFLFYWKHNDFIDRYGTDDVIEMEDTIRATFKQLGKLTLDLKKKSVGGGDGSSDTDVLN